MSSYQLISNSSFQSDLGRLLSWHSAI